MRSVVSTRQPRTIGAATRRRRGRGVPNSVRKSALTPSLLFPATLGVVLILVTLAIYSPVRNHEFLNYDDDVYVYTNSHISSGLNWQSFRWAFTTFEQANWHPLTWISHALDVSLFGVNAGPHLLVSALIHTFNALLLFLILWKATGVLGRSFLVAALFAWHPFNVQSVAWVAERKNVLSTFFVLIAMAAYGWYACSPGWKRFIPVAGAFVLALASKPMAVTLPLMLLLSDFWPLQRVAGWSEPSCVYPVPQQGPTRLLLEKMPLLLLSAASSVVTVIAQRSGKALRSLQALPLRARLGNAACSYVMYLWKAIWPSKFGVYYPHPGTSLALWKPILGTAFLVAVSAYFWHQRKTRPYLLSGWLWFVITLVPVIGIVQVGDQAMADRYAYVPLIGLFVAIVWAGHSILVVRYLSKRIASGAAVTALSVVAAVTLQQIGYWQDSVTLWSHTVQVTPQNALAENQLASALIERGEKDEAMPHLLNVERLDPHNLMTHVNIGVYYASHSRTEDAIEEFAKVIDLTNHELTGHLDGDDDMNIRASALLDLGLAYALSKQFELALLNFQLSAQANADMVDGMITNLNASTSSSAAVAPFVSLSLLQVARNQNEKAFSTLSKGLQSHPGDPDLQDLSTFLEITGRLPVLQSRLR